MIVVKEFQDLVKINSSKQNKIELTDSLNRTILAELSMKCGRCLL